MAGTPTPAPRHRQTDRVIAAEAMRTSVALSVVASTTILGMNGVIDAAAATGVLGAVIGAVGAIGAAAVGGRAAQRDVSDEHTPTNHHREE